MIPSRGTIARHAHVDIANASQVSKLLLIPELSYQIVFGVLRETFFPVIFEKSTETNRPFEPPAFYEGTKGSLPYPSVFSPEVLNTCVCTLET